jgi:hypothetical protein
MVMEHTSYSFTITIQHSLVDATQWIITRKLVLKKQESSFIIDREEWRLIQ